jgi:hypothetical protein
MSTDYGQVKMELPGFPPIVFQTVNEVMVVPRGDGKWRGISARNVRMADGTIKRLSKQERGRLLTLINRCNKRRCFPGSPRYGVIRPYKTLSEVRY